MRGTDEASGSLFSYVDLEERIPARHPLRKIRQVVNDALASLDADFEALYTDFGRPSIPPGRLIRASLLQILFSIRSERQLMEQVQYNLLFRWFLGLGIDDPVRPEYRDHVWSYDFVHCRTDDGRAFRTLNIIDEYSRECLAIRVDRKLNSGNVIDALSDLFILRGVPSFIRSDNGPLAIGLEPMAPSMARFVAQAVQDWIKAVGARTAYIEPGSPWENGYCESFNARFRDEFLNGEIFYSLREAQILIEEWRKHYNTKRPHSALGYRPPAPETIVQMDQRPVMH